MQRPGRRRRDNDEAQDDENVDRTLPDDLLGDVIESTATLVAVIGSDGCVVTANSSFRAAFASGGDPPGRRLEALSRLTTPPA
ncbi:MAG: hypothetical protein ACO3C1_13190, partial [Ilumatobacteraceae bacterium]